MFLIFFFEKIFFWAFYHILLKNVDIDVAMCYNCGRIKHYSEDEDVQNRY